MLLIDRWLDGNKNFYVGKNIYEKYGTNKAIRALLDKGETAYALTLLIKELIAINEKGERPAVVVDKEKAILLPMPKGGDSILKSLEAEWKPLFAQANFLRYDMDKYGGDNSAAVRAACHDSCKKILQLEQECMRIWERRDYYEKHGRLPDMDIKEFVMPTDPLELARLLETCKRQIRRYRVSKDINSKHAQIYLDNLAKYKKITGDDFHEKD
jgi:hypothetical protein